jgi:hypothetical protein
MDEIFTNEQTINPVGQEPQALPPETGDTLSKWKRLLGSRKFWAALIGLVAVLVEAFHPDLHIDQEALVGIIAVIAAYILGTGIEDGLSRSGA